jgi:hypothetical protein
MTTENDNTAAHVAEQGAHVAPERPSSKKRATQKKGAPKGQAGAKGAKTTTARNRAAQNGKKPARASTPRAESKGATILELIGRPKGATLAELMKATGWQPHSVRGYISTLGKKEGRKVTSAKREDGERVYSLSR